MQRDIIIKGRSLGGSSDLTLLAPIKEGFVDSLESVTYKTRIKRVLETLHGARMAAHEHHTARLLSDAVERVGAIHSVRVAVLEPENKVLLAVTFDGSWESYIRVLWDKVGTLLDLIFCGTEEYVLARTSSFAAWERWARGVQVETGFFYGPAESTARDLLYYRRVERMRARSGDPMKTALELRAVLPSAEEEVQRFVNPPNTPTPDDPDIRYVGAPRMVRERVRIGLQGLAALYRLTDLHRPGSSDGDVLRRAAIDLLAEFVLMRDRELIDERLAEERTRFARQLDWLFPDARPALAGRSGPRLGEVQQVDAETRADIQAGILRPYPKITHGLVLMLAFDDACAVGAFLAELEKPRWRLTRDSDVDPDVNAQGTIYRSLSFTLGGLRIAGLGEDELECLPEEFRQGMAARAGLLGDIRSNHPRRWHLPRRFDGIGQPTAAQAIELDGVHAVLQLRCLAGNEANAAYELGDENHPLQREVAELTTLTPGLRLLAVQAMRRNYKDYGDARGEVVAEHFGYADGGGQPEVEWGRGPGAFKRNRIALGEVLIGKANAADRASEAAMAAVRHTAMSGARWLSNGSFLVMRKYRQFVGRLEESVQKTAQDMSGKLPLTVEQCMAVVYAKLMGRTRAGEPLVPVADKNRLNVFTYDRDPTGEQCPLHAHIRRAHPRMGVDAMARPPRLMRRSMSYGPPRTAPDAEPAEQERGLIFMAYNASLGEQFEVVQRWLVGGNSTGSSSGQSCPLLGVPENGLSRVFRFEYAGHTFSVGLEPGIKPFEEAPVLTRLEWGMYLLTPSLSALRALRQTAETAAEEPQALVPWQVARGRTLIAGLKRIEKAKSKRASLEAWKEVLEDPESIDRLDSASVWAAIRADHGGVLRTTYGVLVGCRELVTQIYMNTNAYYSVCGQFDRMKLSFGEIALGMDDGPLYRSLADDVNAAISSLSEQEVFNLSFAVATEKLQAIVDESRTQSRDVSDARFEVGFDVREVLDKVLAALSEEWFGLREAKGELEEGSADWNWKRGAPPLYPGHFTALSRYMFQPNPGQASIELGQTYGRALRKAMRTFVRKQRARGDQLPQRPGRPGGLEGDAPIAKAIFSLKTHGKDDDMVARTMVGVLMGFNPTIIGAVLNVLREWQREGRIGDMRTRLQGRTDLDSARTALMGPMADAALMRPMPQLGWRTAIARHKLARQGERGISIKRGDKLVLGIVSGTQQCLAEGRRDADRLMFGGVRHPGGMNCPTHACPGYGAGIGAMLGTLTAILAWRDCDDLRPGPVPLTFVIEGPSLPTTAKAQPARKRGPSGLAIDEPLPPTRKHETQGLVMAWGDSWLDFSAGGLFDRGSDLRDCLAEVGYQVPEKYCKYSVWPTARTMARAPESFCADLDSAMLSANPPVAVLLSAGGNDSTGSALDAILVRKVKGQHTCPIDPLKLKAHIAAIEADYRTILKAIRSVLDNYPGREPPVIVHGYDHPIPIGHGDPRLGDGYAKAWLYNPFAAKGYDCSQTADLAIATGVMQTLIDELNEMHLRLVTEFKPMLKYVDLRGLIEKYEKVDPKVAWADDLHPTSEAFALMAEKIIRTIAQQAVTTPAQVAEPSQDANSSPSPQTPRPL